MFQTGSAQFLAMGVDSVSPNAVMEVLAMLAVLMIQGRSLSCMAAVIMNPWVALVMLHLNSLSFCV